MTSLRSYFVIAALTACAAPGCGSGGEDVPQEGTPTETGVTETGGTETDSAISETETDSAIDSATEETTADTAPAEVGEETAVDSGTVTEDTAVDSAVDTGTVVVDTAVEPDTFVPDTFVPDTFVADTFVPDTFVADTFVEDTFVAETAVDTGPVVPTTMSLSLGSAHACTVKTDLSLGCWGSNAKGQLGDPTITLRTSPPATPLLTSVVGVGAGDQQTCALMGDGTVKCWGYYFYGSLGDGRTSTTGASFDPTPVNVTGVAGALRLIVGHLHACVLMPDAKAMCWGYNSEGQVGNQSISPNKVPTAVYIKDIAGTGDMTGIRDLALGRNHTCSMMADGQVLCWGYNFYGQLGDGTTTNRAKPAPVTGLTNVVQIAAGNYHTCAVHTDDTVSCWGTNYYGSIGDGSTIGVGEKRPNPTKVSGINNALQIAAGEDVTCARLTTGQVKCWGEGNIGQLGNGMVTRSNVPVLVSGISNAVDLTAHYDNFCAKMSDGTRKCWGADSFGQLGIGTTFDYATPTRNPGLSNVTQISMARYSSGGHGCAVLSDKTLKCWGRGREGQIADSNLNDQFRPVLVSGVAVEQVSTGQAHTCVLLTGGSVSCFGDNNYGALGLGGTAPTVLTATPTPGAVSGIANAKSIVSGQRFNCALLTDNTVKCWGKNDQGQLADGGTTNSATPKSIASLAGISQIAAGGEHACAISSLDKSVSCWGENDNYQAGNSASTTDVKTPVKIALPAGVEPLKLALGENHTCVLLSDKTIACFGDNFYGQIGDGTTTDVKTPKVIAGITTATDLWAGDNFTCVRLESGNVQCWGFNENGQLADGSFTSRSTPGPALIGLTGMSDLYLGRGSNCAKLVDGTARCWGGIYNGALGDGEGEYRSTPVVVSY